jgi:hypothetical protein
MRGIDEYVSVFGLMRAFDKECEIQVVTMGEIKRKDY